MQVCCSFFKATEFMIYINNIFEKIYFTWAFIEYTCKSFRPHHHPYLNAYLTALHCTISFVYVYLKRWYEVNCLRYLSKLPATYLLVNLPPVFSPAVCSPVFPSLSAPVFCSGIQLWEVCVLLIVPRIPVRTRISNSLPHRTPNWSIKVSPYRIQSALLHYFVNQRLLLN